MAKLQLMGAHEIRVRLGGISRQRVYKLTSRDDFPRPVANLEQGKIWRTRDVEAWIRAKRPHLNNPETQPADARTRPSNQA
ncbi:putative DNA-binding transcriptional regulator AlpA [Actinoplanes lutulentus]|nr:DNA-binding protein [Actinoplanes lutulentus]MBB2947807.1 putative DNA-binding transcriptional regulator AlpA [Actinoplanes lutulentus]